ncbi:MAG: hypothetical protein ACNA7V_09490 [Bacteroidales bacterium]
MPAPGAFLKADHFVFGLIIGILALLFMFGLIAGINHILIKMGVAYHTLDLITHIMVSFFGNLILIRYYFVNLKYDKTGRGVLLITFVLVIVLFVL